MNLMNRSGLARALGVPNSWVKEKTRAGEIPCVKIGRKYYYDEHAVEAVIIGWARAGAPVQQVNIPLDGPQAETFSHG